MRRAAAIAAVLAASSGDARCDDRFSLGAGLDYSRGKYGATQTTEILYVPVVARYETTRWLLRLTVPWLRITGPGNVVGGGDFPVVLPPGQRPRTDEEGLGDVVASASWTMVQARRFLLDVTGKTKLPTADEKKGLGTGRADYAFQVDAYQSFGAVTAIAGAGYRWLGDPAGVDFRNVWYGSVGATVRAREGLSAGMTMDYRQAALTTSPDQLELTPFVSWRFAQRYKLQAYGVIGLKAGSPDYGLGVLIYRAF